MNPISYHFDAVRDQLNLSPRLGRLAAAQDGRCAPCELAFRRGQSINFDHIIPRARGAEYE